MHLVCSKIKHLFSQRLDNNMSILSSIYLEMHLLEVKTLNLLRVSVTEDVPKDVITKLGFTSV